MSRPPRLWRASNSSLLLLVTLLLVPLSTLAQIIDPSKVPPCVQTCNNIIAAQNLCSPPVTAQPNTVCFCNSNYLVPLRNSQTTGVCDNICTPAEMQSVLSYYQGLCNNAKPPTAAPAAGATTTITTSTSTSTATAASSQGKGSSNAKSKSWISQHYQWVIMIIVLILAAIAGIIFGIWFKRRNERKQNEKHRNSTLGTHDALQVLRDPHPVASSSDTSQQPMTSQHNKEYYGSAGSFRSGSSNTRTHTMRTSSLGAGMRAPSSSASDVKGKAKYDDGEVMRPPQARRTSSRASQKLQRRMSSGGAPFPVSPAPTSPR